MTIDYLRWDSYFYSLTIAIAKNSRCFSRKVGALIVLDNSIISTGYNGPPRGVPHCDERWQKGLDKFLIEGINKHCPSIMLYHNAVITTDELKTQNLNICPRKLMGFTPGFGLEYCIAGHGERNAIANASRMGIKIKGATMYLNCSVPCAPCLVEIINAGIEEIVVTDISNFYDEESKFLCKYVKMRNYTHGIYID